VSATTWWSETCPGWRPGSTASAELDGSQALVVVDALIGARVRWWVDGGWGVDALLGEQSRDHSDLDLVVVRDDRSALEAALAGVGAAVVADEPPARVVLELPGGGSVDIHLVEQDDGGGAVQALVDGSTWRYPPQVLQGTGVIDGRVVPCLSAEGQLLTHAGYEPDKGDRSDIGLLRDRLGLVVAPPFGGDGPAVVRPAVVDDALAAAVVNRRAALLAYRHIFPSSAPEPTHQRLWEIYRRRFTAPSRGFVLEAAGAVIGCVAAEVDEGGEGEVVGLYVDPSRWREGFAARLLDELLDDLRSVGTSSARLWVLEHNTRARGMYERRGWVADGATRSVSTVGEVIELRYRLAL
jgi:lincosamide nucleotidyltransferase A/C/D/E